MKKITKFLLSVFVVLMVFTCALITEATGIDVKSADIGITTTASAATEGYYTYEVSGGKAKITHVNTKISGKVTVPSELGGYPVTSIGNYAFEECSAMTSIIIPDSVTSIGNEVFSLCVRLADISLPDSLTSLGSDICWDTAFYQNKDNWDNGAVYIGNHLIGVAPEAISDGTYVIREGTKTIAGHAFVFNELLTSIKIPDSVVSIGRYAFLGCEKLTKIIIPASVTSIREGAFSSVPLADVYYGGTQQQWKNIKTEASNEALTKATIHYNYCEHKYETTTTPATLTKNGSIKNACTACGDVKSETVINYPETFTLSATSLKYNGKVRTPSVTVKDSAGKVLKKGTDYTVTYASGRKSVGTYKVTVKMIGNYSGTKTLSFKINPISISDCKVKLSSTSYTYNGKVKTPTVTVTNPDGTKLTKGTSYTVSYSEGRKSVGTYKVTVKMKGNYSGSKTLSFKIKPISISDCKVKLSSTSYTYDGKVKTPTVTVTNPDGTKLTKGTSYTVSYSEGRKSVGTYKVTVKMKGNYSGSKTLSFKIKPISISDCKIKLSSTSYTYDGKVKTPTVIVTNANGKKLSRDTHYTVSYEQGRKNAGTYKVTVKMQGYYTGTKVLTFKINPIDISKCSVILMPTKLNYNGYINNPSITVKNPNGALLTEGKSYTATYESGRKNVGTYKVTVKMMGNYKGTKVLSFKINPQGTTISKLTAGRKNITVGINKKTTQTTGYEIQYSTLKNFTNPKTITVQNSMTQVTLSGLKSGQKYYVRVRTYKIANDAKYYSTWSDYKTIKAK